ncbi:hypothetical protein EWM64_g894 [Hericium alpestre]|uniref:RRM domain-containing protein n=1 Tax=Hericium alpestre TaxID=135208 RepID=A0A4Z0A8P8_9AGAM|nr:hypothetical protein EWM64_g894 [Hericium alpestre]
MSRPDVQDFEYPPGLSSRSSRADPEHGSGQFHSHSGSVSQYSSLHSPPYGFHGVANSLSGQSSLSRSTGIQDREYVYGAGDGWTSAPNTSRHTPSSTPSQVQPFNQPPPHQHPSSHSQSSLAGTAGHSSLESISASGRNGPYLPPPSKDQRDTFPSRGSQPPPNQHSFAYAPIPSNPLTSAASTTSRNTLWWGELEPWMDEQYARQVCKLKGWEPVEVKAHAAHVLAQISNNNNGSGTPITMPNSSKPFVLSWASSTPIPPSLSPSGPAVQQQQQQYPKEYSIFVGDLAPEASNSDLVAVFRNPVLGLRNDREPKFIRPFLSCKSAKIMLDPVTGISRGYGFVRFTDEADQQRALIEMHGLYCLSRPMRISPATAKYKPPPSLDLPQVQIPSSLTGNEVDDYQTMGLALPIPAPTQPRGVSSPIAGGQGAPNGSANSHNSFNMSSSGSGSSMSQPSLSSGPSTSASGSTLATNPSDDMSRLPPDVLSQLAQFTGGSAKSSGNPLNSITAPFATPGQEQQNGSPSYTINEESWKHQAQARAILGNLIGPNGEQLTSTDPYNTTVFVGGLSPLISEDTLRTFFAPFGDIHYVKVPVGKHCGFVQFVRKADAERAIEKMQGFPIGGSRIRLSWGRNKAAQAAAQAAQAAALQAHLQSQTSSNRSQPLTTDQAIQLLQKFGLTSFLATPSNAQGTAGGDASASQFSNDMRQANEEHLRNMLLTREPGSQSLDIFPPKSFNNTGNQGTAQHNMSTSFSPFSPEMNMYAEDLKGREMGAQSRSDMLPHLSKAYMPEFSMGSAQGQDMNPSNSSGKTPPITPTASQGMRPPSGPQRFGSYMENSGSSYPKNTGVISRPPSSSNANRRISPPVREHGEYFEGHDQDTIQDLNGTLASLNLGETHGSSWRLPEHSQQA